MDKRTFIKSIFLGTAGVFAAGFGGKLKAAGARKKWDGIFKLPELPYQYNALEPFIDAQTMELHYAKHHAAYTNNLNTAVKQAGLTGKSAHELLKNVSAYSPAIRNNGGGYLNHKLFWKMLAPTSSATKPSAELMAAINRDFTSMESFRNEFSAAAKSVFGSGWAWLVVDETTGRLKVTATLNQDNPLMDVVAEKGTPVLCLDVWEHAYYLQNQNRRANYIESFWNVVNWDFVSQRYNSTVKRMNKARKS